MNEKISLRHIAFIGVVLAATLAGCQAEKAAEPPAPVPAATAAAGVSGNGGEATGAPNPSAEAGQRAAQSMAEERKKHTGGK